MSNLIIPLLILALFALVPWVRKTGLKKLVEDHGWHVLYILYQTDGPASPYTISIDGQNFVGIKRILKHADKHFLVESTGYGFEIKYTLTTLGKAYLREAEPDFRDESWFEGF